MGKTRKYKGAACRAQGESRVLVGIFRRRVENRFHLLEDLIKDRLITGRMSLRICDRVAVPAAQIVITKDALVVADQGKIGAVVLGVIEDVDESGVV